MKNLNTKWMNYKKHSDFKRRIDFKGKLIWNKITDREEYTFHASDRFVLYLRSISISIPLLLTALFIIMIIFLNMEAEFEEDSIFAFEFIQDLTSSDQIFDRESHAYVFPVFICFCLSVFFNFLYR